MRALNNRNFLGGISASAARELQAMSGERVFFRGDRLFPNVLFPPEPEVSSAVLITEGLVKVIAVSGSHHETLLSIRGSGDLLGENGALGLFHFSRYHRPFGPSMRLS